MDDYLRYSRGPAVSWPSVRSQSMVSWTTALSSHASPPHRYLRRIHSQLCFANTKSLPRFLSLELHLHQFREMILSATPAAPIAIK